MKRLKKPPLTRWFPPPPGLSWQFLWLPLMWALAMVVVYCVVLWLLWDHKHLSPDTALSAGQVFTGLAGIGAAVVALAGIAKQFERPLPVLDLEFEQEGDGGSPLVRVRNIGEQTAHGVHLSLISERGGIFPHASQPWSPSAMSQTSASVVMRLDQPLVAGGEEILSFVGSPTKVEAWATNAPRTSWRPPEIEDV